MSSYEAPRPGPCAKQVVRCTITSASGKRYVGENDCLRPQAACPRLPGEGYGKCTTVCGQRGHAEHRALFAAGADALGATAVVEGHTHACKECQEALFGAGVKWLRVTPRRPMNDQCSLGMDCEEVGVCYADAHGEPDRCGRLA